MLALAWAMPASAQVTNGLLVNSFETSTDLLRFTRNSCSVSLSTNGVTDGQKAAVVVFSNVDWPNLLFKVGTGFTNGDWRGWGAVAVEFHLDLDGSGDEFVTGHCWLPEAAAAMIADIREGLGADGSGEKLPMPAELPDRDWRADPADGLRPLRSLRATWTPES